MNKIVAIKDIARMVGVSHSTVSRALREIPVVNAETAGRIRKVAHEQGYRAMKRLLACRKRPTAVFCYDDLTARC